MLCLWLILNFILCGTFMQHFWSKKKDKNNKTTIQHIIEVVKKEYLKMIKITIHYY